MNTFRAVIVVIQALTMVALGALFIADRNWRFAAAQLLLGVVTVLVYA